MYIPITQHVINHLPEVNTIEDLIIFKSLGFIEFRYRSHMLRVELNHSSQHFTVHERIGTQSLENDFTSQIETILNRATYHD